MASEADAVGMNQGVVEAFLGLPGVVGVALMDGRARPYFFGLDEALSFQQKETLTQGILQVIKTAPEGVDAFEIYFTGYQIYIYKLPRNIIFLALTSSELVPSDYLQVAQPLLQALQDNTGNVIATFGLLASNIMTQSGQNYWGKSPIAEVSASVAAEVPTLVETIPPPSVTIKDLVSALNQLSDFTKQYLGTTLIANYWQATRPKIAWLDDFQIKRGGEISFSGSLTIPLTVAQHQEVQQWVTAFIQRCTQIIRDFRSLVEHKGLTEEHKHLLLEANSNLSHSE